MKEGFYTFALSLRSKCKTVYNKIVINNINVLLLFIKNER